MRSSARFQSSLPHLLRELRQIKPQQKIKASNAAFYRKLLSQYAATTPYETRFGGTGGWRKARPRAPYIVACC